MFSNSLHFNVLKRYTWFSCSPQLSWCLQRISTTLSVYHCSRLRPNLRYTCLYFHKQGVPTPRRKMLNKKESKGVKELTLLLTSYKNLKRCSREIVILIWQCGKKSRCGQTSQKLELG